MSLLKDRVLPVVENLARTRSTSALPASAFIHDDPDDSSPGLRQNAKQVQNALDNLKMSAVLAGVDLKESDIRIGKNMIIVDDRVRRG